MNQPSPDESPLVARVSDTLGWDEDASGSSVFSALMKTTPVVDRGLIAVQTNHRAMNIVEMYERELGSLIIDSLRELVSGLAGIKVAHINATSYGGGVAELLHRQVPLMNQLGESVEFRTDWLILNVENPTFYDATKRCHNLLQGDSGQLSPEDEEQYFRTLLGNYNFGKLSEYDVVIIHDPQPIGLIDLYPRRKNKWVWRCHIDTTTPNPTAWQFVEQFAKQYDMTIWTRESFVHDRSDFRDVRIIMPSIDPLSPKNKNLDKPEIDAVFAQFGIDRSKPVMLQVSRFDPWKQPLEVIHIYQDLKTEFPGLQLILTGSMATDDPEGMLYWEKSLRRAGEDPNVFILNNYHGVGSLEINAFQRGADVVMQYSSKEGFGLTVSEGMWKYQPVIGGRTGGIQDQIVDGQTGYLVSTLDEAKSAVRELLEHKEKRKQMGESARLYVTEHFLITREVADYLKLIRDLCA